MQLHKTLSIVAAALAAGLLGLTSTSTANAAGTPIGSPVGYIAVNGSTAVGTPAIDGVFLGGSSVFAGSSYTCSGGTFAGTITRGAVSATPDLSFSTVNMTCNTPTGNATISVNSGCSVTVDFPDQVVNDGTIDTGAGAKYFNVAGTATLPNIAYPGCVKISTLGGLCTANAIGTGISAQLDEAVHSVGGVNYQDLIFNGAGSIVNQSGCLGLMTGTFVLNNLAFHIKVTGGSTSGIDFRVNP